MGKQTFGMRVRHRALVMAAILSLVASKGGLAKSANSSDGATTTPIKHVVIIIGENRTFDEIFATYHPVRQGTMVSNLLSKGIVNADGSPGPSYDLAKQYSATDTDEYRLAPAKIPYETLPPAMVGGPETAYGCQLIGITAGASCDTSENEQKVAAFETAIDPSYLKFLLTGGTGQPKAQPDSRIIRGTRPDVASARPLPAHLGHDAVRRLCSKPGPQALSDVAAARLLGQDENLRERSVPVGRSDSRGRLERRRAA